jgi:O-acetyl-ADP-ribose deacetylase (regulator of RNase III)
MIINYVKGDLIAMIDNNLANKSTDFLFAAHGCNCFCTQGSGIAGQLRKFPEIYRADVDNGCRGNYYKLGTISEASIDCNITILNMYTQFKYGTDKRHANYAAIAMAFKHANDEFAEHSHPLYIPKIGSDLAGGDWDIISMIIDDATPDLDVIVLEFEPTIDPRG